MCTRQVARNLEIYKPVGSDGLWIDSKWFRPAEVSDASLSGRAVEEQINLD